MEAAHHIMMRRINLLNVLHCVRNHGPLTKREIQEKTGLSWGAVSNFAAELAAKGILSSKDSDITTVRRTPLLLDISERNNLIIGIDINIEGLMLVVIDLKCRMVLHKKEHIKEFSLNGVLRQVIDLISMALSDKRVPQGEVIGIGIAMQGSVDHQYGISRYAPFDGWHNVALKKILWTKFGIPVSVIHDPVCMVLAEKWLGCAKDASDFILVRLSKGLGMGIFVNNMIYTGHDGTAGEIAHIIVEPNGNEICSCGNIGCLELFASVKGIIHRVYSQRDVKQSKYHDLDIEKIASMARDGDSLCKRIFDEAGFYLGTALASVVNTVNPQIIILNGNMLAYKDLYYSRLCVTLEERKWRYASVKVEFSELKSSAALGAAISFVQSVFSGGLEKLLQSQSLTTFLPYINSGGS